MPAKTATERERDVALKEKPEFPRKFKVVLLNDDVTSMDFVVSVLVDIFNRDMQSAVAVMLKIHNEGSGVAGVYTKEIAQTKQNAKSSSRSGLPAKGRRRGRVARKNGRAKSAKRRK